MTTKILGLTAQAGVAQINHMPGVIVLPPKRVVSVGWNDAEDRPNLTFKADNVQPSATAASDDDKPVFVLIQEGGTSFELYIHAHTTREDAEDDRVSCETDGAYRTSDILEVPSSLADEPGFYELAEKLVCAVATLASPYFIKGNEALVEVPEGMAAHPKFFEVAQQLVGAVSTIDFPETV
jgi:hypothetical protein